MSRHRGACGMMFGLLCMVSGTALLGGSQQARAQEPTAEESASDDPAALEEPASDDPAALEEPAATPEPTATAPTAEDAAPAPIADDPAPAPAATDEPLSDAAPAPPARLSPTPPPLPSPTPVHPLRVRWGITAPVIATTSLGFFLMEGLGSARPAPVVCTPPQDGMCPDLGGLEPIDRVALGHYDHTAAKASDVMVALSLAGPLVVSLAESIAWARGEHEHGAAQHRRRGAARFGIDTAIWVESIGVAMLTANVLKDAVGRPRPLTHLDEATLMAEGVEPDGDFGRSFPSGHATLAFSSVTAGAMLLTLRQCEPQAGRHRCAPRTRTQRLGLALMWGLGMATAATTATLRVVAGKHYPTDVLMGAVLGASSGIVVPLLHDRRRW